MALHIRTTAHLEQLEKELRAHPMVAARLSHKRDMFAAEAAVRNYVWGEPFPDQGWAGTGTARQIKFAFDQLTKKKQ